jgi:tetratricopeptide (TPR) repeat protein
VAALRGELRQARTLARRAVELEQRDRHPGAAAAYATSEAIWEAVWGNAAAATTRADFALGIARGRDVDFGAALAFALAGETRRLPAMIAEMSSRFPDDTSVQTSYLPSLRAFVALAQRQPGQALDALDANIPYEHARPALAFYWNFGGRYPAYLRGVALLADGQPREAAAAFEALLNRRGLLLADPLGARARVQLGRAYAKAGDIQKARAAYESCFALTKTADPGLPLATEARREFSLLK